jgi:integrase
MAPNVWYYAAKHQWVSDVVEAGGKRRRWYLGSDEQAARREFHLRMAALYGQAAVPPPQTLTVEDLASLFLAWVESNRTGPTVLFYRTYLSWLVSLYGGEIASELSPPQVEAVKAAHRQASSPRAINAFVGAVKRLYTWGIDQGYVTSSPAARTSRVPKAPQRIDAIPLDRLHAMFPILDRQPPLGDWCRVLLGTAMRAGELEGLRWDAYDASLGLITLTRHKTVGLTGKARRLSARGASQILDQQPRTGEAIFSDDQGRPISAASLRQRLGRLKRQCPDVLAGFTFHALRHTFVKLARERGAGEYEIQQQFGHSSTLMVRYYSHLDIEQLHKVTALVGGV